MDEGRVMLVVTQFFVHLHVIEGALIVMCPRKLPIHGEIGPRCRK